VAAPDHKIRQCIQRSALFPGVGQMDGPTVPSDSREVQSAEGVSLGRGVVAPLH